MNFVPTLGTNAGGVAGEVVATPQAAAGPLPPPVAMPQPRRRDRGEEQQEPVRDEKSINTRLLLFGQSHLGRIKSDSSPVNSVKFSHLRNLSIYRVPIEHDALILQPNA